MSFSMLDIGVAVTGEGKGGAWVDMDIKQWLDKKYFLHLASSKTFKGVGVICHFQYHNGDT